MDKKLTFLGTGTSQGVPVIGCQCAVCKSGDPRDNRLRTAAMISVGNKHIVIDTGPDFRQQMLRTGIRDLKGVVFTHAHKDHIAGLDDVRAFNFINKRAIDIYATAEVQEALKREFHYVFSDFKYPGIPQLDLHTIDGNKPFDVSGVEMVPIEVMHYKLPVLGFRVSNMAYITDANYIAPEEMEKLKDLDVLVLNALRKEKHISHFTLDEAIEIVERLKPKRAYFTHISHLMGKHEEVEKLLPDGIFLAQDGLETTFS